MNHKHYLHHMALALGFCAVLASPGRAENPTATPEQWENAIRIIENQVAMQQDRLETVVTQWKATDQQIERRMERVQQALELVSSLPADKQTQQYRQEAHAQNKLLREKAIARLKMSADRLRRSRSELERALSYVRTAEEKTFIKGLIVENDELVAQRHEQLERALMQTAAKSKPVGKSAADALLELVAQARRDTQRDFAEWNRLKSQRDLEHQNLDAYKVRLANYRIAY